MAAKQFFRIKEQVITTICGKSYIGTITAFDFDKDSGEGIAQLNGEKWVHVSKLNKMN